MLTSTPSWGLWPITENMRSLVAENVSGKPFSMIYRRKTWHGPPNLQNFIWISTATTQIPKSTGMWVYSWWKNAMQPIIRKKFCAVLRSVLIHQSKRLSRNIRKSDVISNNTKKTQNAPMIQTFAHQEDLLGSLELVSRFLHLQFLCSTSLSLMGSGSLATLSLISRTMLWHLFHREGPSQLRIRFL